MKELLKKRLIINGKLLGTLLLFLDSKDNPSLKFSFKEKTIKLNLWNKKDVGAAKNLVTSKPVETRSASEGASLDISYKFKNNRIEVKSESHSIVSRALHEVNLKLYLFRIIYRDIDTLSHTEPNSTDIVVVDKKIKRQIAVIFGFFNERGFPISPSEYIHAPIHTVLVDLPDQKITPLVIGLVEDTTTNLPNMLIIDVPHKITKIT